MLGGLAVIHDPEIATCVVCSAAREMHRDRVSCLSGDVGGWCARSGWFCVWVIFLGDRAEPRRVQLGR